MAKTYIERRELGGRNPDVQFGWQQMARNFASGYEFLPPASRRLVFTDEERQQAAQDVYQAWQALQKDREYRPVLPEVTFARLSQARLTRESVTLFVPWGVRPQGEIGREFETFEKMLQIQKLLASKNIPTQFLIMPADVYATEVNGIDERKTTDYFARIKTEAERRGMIVKPWSQIRAENKQRYDMLAESLSEKELERIVSKSGAMEQILSTARRRTERADARLSAYAYLRERVVEGQIIEELYKPIKVSLAPKYKDKRIDGSLPRLYVIPGELLLPWLKNNL